MITKAIVEEIISPYQARVRIPLLDRIESSSVSTDNSSLNVATICTLPNCYANIQVGDIVFVGFEDNTYYKAVILGHLCRKASTDTYVDITLGNIFVNSSAKLPVETQIGVVTPFELSQLSGVRDNLQQQIDYLQSQVQVLENKLTSLRGGS